MLFSGPVKVIPDSVIESLYQVCHAGSYEKLAATVKVEQRDRTCLLLERGGCFSLERALRRLCSSSTATANTRLHTGTNGAGQ